MNNVYHFYDWASEDACTRLVELAQERRRAQQRAIDAWNRRQRERKLRWVINAVMIVMIGLACFAAGACWGCM